MGLHEQTSHPSRRPHEPRQQDARQRRAAFTVDDIPLSLVGAPCTCLKKGHKHCKIAVGNAGHTIDGVTIAYEGCLTTCGATLVATVPNFATA
ncbi:PAAR domain-containing protein [Massilia sp. DD77]|uniref:PAAR domain-containing protein n=1 Tax=Massilia sp. DD77 TaxID=3109349 RepID=UPI003FA5BDFC